MALEGKYTYKGIDIAKAYIMVTNVNASNYISSETTEKTPKKYNEDGSVKSEAVMETKWVKNLSGNWSAAVYKDKDATQLLIISVVILMLMLKQVVKIQ